VGLRRFLSWERERDEDESDEEPESEESESESEEELDPEEDEESETEPEERDDLRAFFLGLPLSGLPPPFALLRSLSSSILFAVPVFVLNSSGRSTLGWPSFRSFAKTLGFSSCSVRDGRETYGLFDLHS